MSEVKIYNEETPEVEVCEGEKSADVSWILYASFILFGMSQLLPWNIYIKSVPYFRACLADSLFAPSLGSSVSTCFTLSNFGAMVLLVIFRYDELLFSTGARVIIGIGGNALLMLLMAALTFFKLPNGILFSALLFLTAMAGIFTACLMKGLLAVTARFPPQLTPALLGGQATAGLLVSVANAATSFKERSTDAIGPIVYFTVGSALLVAALLVFIAHCLRSPKFRWQAGFDSSQSFDKKSPLQRVSYATMIAVFWRIKWLALGLFITLAVTVSLFTLFITASRFPHRGDSSSSDYFSLLYVPVIFIIDDFADVIGRWIPAIPILAGTPRSSFVLLLPWLRLLLLYPLFFLVAPVNVASRSMSPAYLVSFGFRDYLYGLSAFVFGITHGYCCTTLLMHAPTLSISKPSSEHRSTSTLNPSESLSDGKEKEACGALMGLFLNTGLVLGSLSTFIWRLIL